MSINANYHGNRVDLILPISDPNLLTKSHIEEILNDGRTRGPGITLENVKCYGRKWGKILRFLGVASSVDLEKGKKCFVNRESFLKKLISLEESTLADSDLGITNLNYRQKVRKMTTDSTTDKTLHLKKLDVTKITSLWNNLKSK